MKVICKVNQDKEYKKFQPFKLVIEVAKKKMREVTVEVGGYSDNHYLAIKSAGVTLRPDSLTVSSSQVSVPELLLNVEICNFVMNEHPELKKVSFR